jgi:glycosyltransferase involved in cell wall biosynthesis
VVRFGGTDDWRRDAGLLEDPCEGNLGIVDTQGLEVGKDNKQILSELHKAMTQMRQMPLSEQIHVAWYCVRGMDRRFEEAEADFLASVTVGLMPLADGPWERGKCSFKMLQYMAAGRPCVVSPVGMNNELLAEAEIGRAAATLDEWSEALSSLLAERDAAERMGQDGRLLAAERYSVTALAPQLAALLRRLA